MKGILRRIDRWVGRHMSKKGWIVYWSFAAVACFAVGILNGGCVGILLCVCGVASIILIWGNARRPR